MQREIDVFYIAKKIKNLLNEYKKFVYMSLFIFAFISIASFLYVRFNPEYILTFQLKSKNIGIQEISPFASELNSIINEKSNTDKPDPLASQLKSLQIVKISIDEIISEAAVLKNVNVVAYYYEVKIIVRSDLTKVQIDKAKELIVAFLKDRLDNSEVSIQKYILNNNIKELGHILDSTYTKKINSAGNTFVIENMHKGLSDLQQLISNNVYQLKFYEKENLINSDYPIISSHRIKYPWIIFLFGLISWISSVGAYLIWKILFPKEEKANSL